MATCDSLLRSSPELPPIKTDRDKLKQVVLNLLSNSAKFTEAGEIKVAAWRENGSAEAGCFRHRHRHEQRSLALHLR